MDNQIIDPQEKSNELLNTNEIFDVNKTSFEETMKMLESVDTNTDKTIDQTELENALSSGFFEQEGNIRKITEELKKYTTENIEGYYKEIKKNNGELWSILKTFNKELEDKIKIILKKEKEEGGKLTNEEIKIMQLWEIMFGKILKTKLQNRRLTKKTNDVIQGYENKANNIAEDVMNRKEYYSEEDKQFVEEYLDLWGDRDENRREMLLDWIYKGEIVDTLEKTSENLMGYEKDILKSQMGWENITQNNITELLNTINEKAEDMPIESLIICDKMMGCYFNKFINESTLSKIKQRIENGVNNKINGYNTQIQKLSVEGKKILESQLGISEITRENVDEFEELAYKRMKSIIGTEKNGWEDGKFCAIYYTVVFDGLKGINFTDKKNIEEKIVDIYNQNILGIKGLSVEQAEELKNKGEEYSEIYDLLGCGKSVNLEQKIKNLTEGSNLSDNIDKLDTSINNITSKIWGNDTISGVDKTVVNIRYRLFGKKGIEKIENGSYNKDNIAQLYTLNKCDVLEYDDKLAVENWIEKQISEVSTKYNRDIANSGNTSGFCKNELDVRLIQLYASINLDDNEIKITGEKSKNYNNSFDKIDETGLTNAQRTDMYILRQEIKTKGEMIKFKDNKYPDILNMPNFDALIKTAGSQEIQDKILCKFFKEVYLPIKKSGLYFENKITGDRLEKILEDMINAERDKDTPVGSGIFEWRCVQNLCKGDENSDTYQLSVSMINELQKYKTMGEYYDAVVKVKIQNILENHNNNIENERIKYLNSVILQLNKDILDLDEKNQNKQEYENIGENEEYKESYKKIADKFIKLRRDPKYRKYLENENFTTQIFIFINHLRKDETESVFGNDIKKSIDNIINQLNSFSDAENDELEQTTDLYYFTMYAEQNECNWGESHFSTTFMTGGEYIQPIDNACINQNQRRCGGFSPLIEVTEYKDIYTGNGYNEGHSTTIKEVDITNNKLIYERQAPTEGERLVGPNPNGWYAILPQELKDKSNKGQTKLAIIMGKPCVYEFQSNGDIKYWVYDKEKKKLVFDRKMTQAEYTRAITIESSRMKVRETEHGEELQNIQKELKVIMDKNDFVNNLINERKKGNLDGNEAESLRRGSITLYNAISGFATPQMRKTLITLRQALQKLNQDSNGYENPYEKQIKEYIKNINGILGFATDEQVKSAKQFMEFCTDTAKVHENDDWYDKTWQERVTIAVSFLVAIAMTIVAIVTRGLGSPLAAGGWVGFGAALAVGAISTSSAMIATEITQEILNNTTSGGHIVVDGVEYELDYNNPTLLQQALDPNSPVTFRDCVKGYGTQFITGTLLQGLLMRGGSQASLLISKLVAKSPAGSFARKSSELVCKILSRDRKIADPYTEGLINSVQRQAGKEGFMKQFSRELLEETREESVEQAAQAQGAVLGAIATVIHCIKPHPGQALQLAKVGHPKFEIPEGQKKLIAETTYDGTNPDNLTILKNYYEGLPGYTVTQEEGGILRVVAHGVSDGNVSIIDAGKTIEMEFRPSNAPLHIRGLSEDLLSMGGIQIDEKTGNITYRSKSNLMALSTYYRHNNLGNIKINKDGTAQIITPKETITLTQSSDYSEDSIFDVNTRRFEIIGLSEEIGDLDTEIQSIKDEISQLPEGDPYKELLKKQKSELEDKCAKSKKRKKSLESAIEIVEQRTTKYDPETIQRQIAEKREKLSNMDKNSKDYKNLEKEIKNLENKKESGVCEIFQNGELLLQKSTFREKLTLKLKKLKCELKRLYYNATQNGQKIEETKNEIKNIEREIHALDLEIADIIKLTYSGLRNLKGLEDSELMELTHTYYEKILKPMQFAIINPSQTFDSDIVSHDFSTQREVSIEGIRENPNKFATMREKIKGMRLGSYVGMKSISDISTFINENFEEGSMEKQILLNLKKSLQENVELDDARLSEEDRAVIFLNGVSYMLDYTEAYPEKTGVELYEILDINQNKLIHQHIQDKHFLTGSSHDVLHILRGNMNMAENIMENMSPKERVLTRQIIIDHDMGYTSVFNHLLSGIRSDVFFDATKDHPLRSSQFVEDNMSWYQDQFGNDGYQIIRNSITGHSKPDTVNLPTGMGVDGTIREKQIDAVISVVDCVAASADYKSAFLFGQPEIAGEFMSVYTAMNTGNINEAIEGLHKIVDTVNTIKNPQLKSAIADALNSLHLMDPVTGEITLDNQINKINEMTESDIDKARKKLVAKLNDPDKSKKTLGIFCKANGIADPSTVTENTITSEQVKNYLKFDYINDRVSFPYEKYLSQYGVRVSIDAEGKTMIGVNEKGVVEATFELAGSSFETLLNTGRDNYDFKGKTVADFALASFLKVCDDMNVELTGGDIGILKQHINNRVKNNEGKTLSQYLSSKYNQNNVEFKGRKGERIVLNFDGKSYEGFDQIMEFENKIDKLLRSENKFEAIENVRELFDSYTRISESVGNVYMVNQQELASYLKDIQTRLNNMSDSEMGSFIEGIANNMRKGYFTMSDNFVTQN